MATLREKYADRHPSVMEVLRWLERSHLPDDLRPVADVFTNAADVLLGSLGDSPQLVRGLHAMVEAKDCMVRQRILDRERSIGG